MGLPGRTLSVGAGEGCDGGGMLAVTFAREGEAIAVGVARGVPD